MTAFLHGYLNAASDASNEWPIRDYWRASSEHFIIRRGSASTV